MRPGQGCIHTCTLLGEIYQVQWLLSSLQVLEVAISLILSEEEAPGSIWCIFSCLGEGSVVKLLNLNPSFSLAI